MIDNTPVDRTSPETRPTGDTQGLDEILNDMNLGGYFDSNRINEIKQQILQWVNDEVIGEEIDYDKNGPCPACTATRMYQCTCDNGSLHTVIRQRHALKQHGFKEGGE